VGRELPGLRRAQGLAAAAARGSIAVARCTVERLMRAAGLRGVIRGKAGAHDGQRPEATPCPLDKGEAPVQGRPAERAVGVDFTYVSTWQGFVYVAFVIDVFARRIVGWRGRLGAHGLRARRAGAGAVRPQAPSARIA
jgi:transposase InsO family protein